MRPSRVRAGGRASSRWPAVRVTTNPCSFCTPDHDHREGFVAVIHATDGSGERIVGHLCLEPAGGHVAEVAVAVADDVQHQGIGRRLLDAGVRWALAEGFTTLTASAFLGNAPIHHLLAGLERQCHASDAGSGIEDIRIELRVRARCACGVAIRRSDRVSA